MKKLFPLLFLNIIISVFWTGHISAQSKIHYFKSKIYPETSLRSIEIVGDKLYLFFTSQVIDSVLNYPRTVSTQLVVNKDFEILKRNILKLDTQNIYIVETAMSEDSSYFILFGIANNIGWGYDSIKYISSFCSAKMDLQLHLQNLDLKLSEDSLSIGQCNIHYSKRDMGFVGTCLQNYIGKKHIKPIIFNITYLIDSNGNFTRIKPLKSIDKTNYFWISDILPNRDTNGYIGFSTYFFYYDDSLNIYKVDTPKDNTLGMGAIQGRVIELRNGQFIGGGSGGGSNLNFIKLTTDYQLIKKNKVYLDNQYYPYWMGDGRCIDKYYDNLIYSSQMLHSYQDGIAVTMIDSNLEVQWTKYYVPQGRKRASYSLFDVKCDRDSSCYIGGLKYYGPTRDTVAIAFIMHIGPDGRFITSTSRPVLPDPNLDITLFPNPSKGDMTIRYEGKKRRINLDLLNMNGIQVKHLYIHHGENNYSFYDLFPGTYFYTIRGEGGEIIGTGKWVKR